MSFNARIHSNIFQFQFDTFSKLIENSFSCVFSFVTSLCATVNAFSNTGGSLTSAEHLVAYVCILNKYSAFKDLYPVRWKIFHKYSVNASFCDGM